MNQDQTKMTFGQWVRQERLKQGLTLQSLARRRAGLEPATISRSENEQSQVTMLTAVRLCTALGFDVNDIIQNFISEDTDSNGSNGVKRVFRLINYSDTDKDNQGLHYQQINQKLASNVLSVYEVIYFVSFYQVNTDIGNEFLLKLLNMVVDMNNLYIYEKRTFMSDIKLSEKDFHLSKPYSLTEVERLVRRSDITHGEIHYPEIHPDIIKHTYDQDGALITEDARWLTEIALRTISRKSIPYEKKNYIDDIIHRLANTSVERTKLDDIIGLEILTESNRQLINNYWQAALIIDEIQCRQNDKDHPYAWPYDWQYGEHSLAILYILVGRWLQHLGLNDIEDIKRSYLLR